MTIQPGANLYTQGFGSRPEGVEVPVFATVIPNSTDVNYPLGKRWINTTANSEYVLTSFSSAAGIVSANWTSLGSAEGELNTLTGDSGGAISPSAGNINLDGTADQITTTGSGSTITWSLSDTLVTPGSLTVTGLLTGDASATINTAGTALNLATDNDTAQVNIGTGTSGRTIDIGTSAAANLVNIGSTSSTSALALKFGSGNCTIAGAVAGTITIGAAAQTGLITLGNSSTTSEVDIASGAGVSTVKIAGGTGGNTVDIASGAGANTVVLGSTHASSTTTINAPTAVAISSSIATAPANSNTATAAFVTTLTANTGAQNTTGYDLLCNITIVVTAATTATITLGVGSGSSPTANTVVPSFSTASALTYVVSAYVPNNYYLLYNTSGTITVGSVTVQSMAI